MRILREVKDLNLYGQGDIVSSAWPCACAEHGCLPGHWHAVATARHTTYPDVIHVPQMTSETADGAILSVGLVVAGMIAFAPRTESTKQYRFDDQLATWAMALTEGGE
jgi:hypothetical protein